MNLWIKGTYQTKFGELWTTSLRDLCSEAITGSLTAAALDPTDIEAVVVANMGSQVFEGQAHLGALVSQMFPHHPPAVRVEGACASGGLALQVAVDTLRSGRCQTVMVLGLEKMTDRGSAEVSHMLSGAGDREQEPLTTFPGLYALMAKAHMQAFGTTREQLALPPVLSHRHALDNPQAQFRKAISIADVINSQLVANPLRVFDCSPITDGAAAIIITSKPQKTGVKLAALAQAQDTLDLASRASLLEMTATKAAVQSALEQAGLGIGKILIFELHDCFSIAQILAVEDLGLCPKGQGGPFHEALMKQESVLINPSGGLKACGHPVGASGIKQLVWIADTLRANKEHYGLAHNVGGSGATVVVSLWENVI